MDRFVVGNPPQYYVLRDKKGVEKATVPSNHAFKVVANDNGVWETATITNSRGLPVEVRRIRVTTDDGKFVFGAGNSPAFAINTWKDDVLEPLI